MRRRHKAIPSSAEPLRAAIAIYGEVKSDCRAKNGLFLDRQGRRRRPAHLWPLCNLLHALVTMSELAGDKELVADAVGLGLALACYRRPPGGRRRVRLESAPVPPFGKGGDAYYDDNAWAGLSTVALYEVTGDAGWLELSRGIFNFVRRGWSRDPSFVHPGGIRWAEPTWATSRHAVSTGAGCELAASLFIHTGEDSYLQDALRFYRWLHEALIDRDGLVVDRIEADGRRENTRWSYNQGVLVGAATLLAQATGEERFHDDAVQGTRRALAWFEPERLDHQGPAFNAIFFRNLLRVDETRPEVHRALSHYLDEALLHHGERPRMGAWVLNRVAPLIELLSLAAGGEARP